MTGRSSRAALAALCASVCLFAGPVRAEPRLPTRAAVGAYLLGPHTLVAGSTASFRIAVHWASGPETSGPLPGARVELTILKAGGAEQALARGTSDAGGSVDLRFTVPRHASGGNQLKVRVVSALGGTEAASQVQIVPGGRLLLTSDKNLYQPGQTIHTRLLALRGIDLRPLAGSMVVMQVKDPRGNVITVKRQRTSRFGIASLDLPLADEINLGSYRIEAWSEGAGGIERGSRVVEVKRYVLPKIRVSVETDRPYYTPGEVVRGTVRARYFFGKPVQGSLSVKLIGQIAGGPTVGTTLSASRLDAEGRGTFEAPASGGRGVGELRVIATVTDDAGQRQQGDIARPLTSSPLSVALASENSHLVPGLRNRIHVIAGYPDGRPAVGATVELSVAGQRQRLSGRTDALGVLTLAIQPPAPVRNGEEGTAVLRVEAKDRLGLSAVRSESLRVARWQAVLIRPARALIPAGSPVEAELLAPPVPRLASGEQVFLDVVKSGQTLATFTRRVGRAGASVSFQPSAALFGLLELRAYRLAANGERVGTSRLVYVDHPGELRIGISADRTVYRPGERARIRFRVSDSRSGEGVEAALGLVAIDDAVVALGGLQESTPKVFFTLADYVWGRGAPRVMPAGRDLAGWVMGRDPVARRTRALEVLLASAKPVETTLFETNPWRVRREAWDRQAPSLLRAARAFMRDHSVGERRPKGWRFASDLLPRMAAAGAIRKEEVQDPWRQVVRPWHLHAIDRSFVFAKLAEPLARDKLREIYQALAAVWEELKLSRERVPRLAARRQPLILPRDLLARLVKRGELRPSAILDPWGQRYRILLTPRSFVNPYYTGLVSRTVIHSAGPDGVSGTRDDIGPEGPRRSVRVFGRDHALGIDAEDALGGLIGNQIGEASGAGGLGLIGNQIGEASGASGLGLIGHGGGGGGMGYGHGVGIGRIGSIGSGGGLPARIRSSFPETLLWNPELVTDRSGRASLEVPLADSITTWKLLATGSTENGLLGSASLDLRVFQDFFVDLELPVALTQGDRVSVPVTVYNYLKTRQRVTLRLAREPWFEARGPLEQSIELEPSQVGVRRFTIVARRLGRQEITVHVASSAKGVASASDAIRRQVQIEPDGIEHATSHAGTLRASGSTREELSLSIPKGAIAMSEQVQLSLHPGALSQTLAGMEGMLRSPHGCFEQTSSATYPNVLILDTLRRAGGIAKAVEARAKELIAIGYQRLVSFEVQGGGFSWFGNAPANRILTAYGLQEFKDMSRVHPVDPALIARTARWLAVQQDRDGSWPPDGRMILDGAGNAYTKDRLRITAYIAGALRHADYAGHEVKRALAYVRKHASSAKDPYTIAVVASLLARDGDEHARAAIDRLWRERREGEKGIRGAPADSLRWGGRPSRPSLIWFEGPAATLTHGAGQSGKLETTALAALALLRSPNPPRGIERVLETLTSSKDSFGSWYSTQATILSLQALLLQHERSRSRPDGVLEVLVDGARRASLRLRGDEQAHVLDLTRELGAAGTRKVALRFQGKGNLQYQLVGRYWLPRAAMAPAASPGSTLAITTRYDRDRARAGESFELQVEVKNQGRKQVEMPLVSLALPPGLAIDEDALSALVREKRVEKVQRIGGRAVLYLSQLSGGQTLRFSLALESKHPLRVQARPSTVYEYYRPENRAESAPRTLEVL